MDASEFLRIEASRTRGVQTQKGLLVVRPTFAVFVPTEAAVNALATIVGGSVGAMAGFVVRVQPGQFPNVTSWISALTHLPGEEFDAHLWHAAQSAGWWVATPQDSKLLFAKVPLFGLFNRYKFYLRRGDDHVGAVFGVPAGIVRPAEPILGGWPRM